MIRPILFNTEMVKAILDGRKTVTRRKIDVDIVNKCDMEADGTLLNYHDCYGDFYSPTKLCHFQPGNILWVRETWSEWTDGYLYRAWNEPFPQPSGQNIKWHPSIHMPREAARIFLKVTDVRVERLQDITDKEAQKEGIIVETNNCRQMHRLKFSKLWDSTVNKSDIKHYGWEANPYVWVIEFERCEKPEDF